MLMGLRWWGRSSGSSKIIVTAATVFYRRERIKTNFKIIIGRIVIFTFDFMKSKPLGEVLFFKYAKYTKLTQDKSVSSYGLFEGRFSFFQAIEGASIIDVWTNLNLQKNIFRLVSDIKIQTTLHWTT